ncbi:MAG: DHHW family protein [Oscillospiraceae bacterium]
MQHKKLIIVSASIAVAAVVFSALLFSGTIDGIYRAITKKPDKDGFYTVNSYTAQAIGEFTDKSVALFAKKLNAVKSDYFADSKVYFALIPDKTFYLSGYETADYPKLKASLDKSLSDFNIIDLYPFLSIDDYYKTDGHWRQEKLVPIADILLRNMGASPVKNEYTQMTKDNFVGSYSKHIKGKPPLETLVYLTDKAIDASTVDNYQNPAFTSVYDIAKLDSALPYDVFLSGATPLVTIKSPLARSLKELVVFRDSFASSLAPLLLDEYCKVTLIDLRYMASPLLKEMISFTGQDVLFIYSTNIVKSSAILR